MFIVIFCVNVFDIGTICNYVNKNYIPGYCKDVDDQTDAKNCNHYI